jgi:hypothetical protein
MKEIIKKFYKYCLSLDLSFYKDMKEEGYNVDIMLFGIDLIKTKYGVESAYYKNLFIDKNIKYLIVDLRRDDDGVMVVSHVYDSGEFRECNEYEYEYIRIFDLTNIKKAPITNLNLDQIIENEIRTKKAIKSINEGKEDYSKVKFDFIKYSLSEIVWEDVIHQRNRSENIDDIWLWVRLYDIETADFSDSFSLNDEVKKEYKLLFLDKNIKYFLFEYYVTIYETERTFYVYDNGEFRLANSEEDDYLREMDDEYYIVEYDGLEEINLEDYIKMKKNTENVIKTINEDITINDITKKVSNFCINDPDFSEGMIEDIVVRLIDINDIKMRRIYNEEFKQLFLDRNVKYLIHKKYWTSVDSDNEYFVYKDKDDEIVEVSDDQDFFLYELSGKYNLINEAPEILKVDKEDYHRIVKDTEGIIKKVNEKVITKFSDFKRNI